MMTTGNYNKKKSASHHTMLLSISLILYTLIGLMLQATQTTESLIVYPLLSRIFPTEAFANQVEEILISLENSTFLPLTTAKGNQLKVSLNYDLQNASITGQTINAVMKLYDPDGTLIKTSSFPAGFTAQSSGKAELKSTLTNKSIQNPIANVTFTNSAKTDIISNELSIPLKLVGIKPEVNSSNSTETELTVLSSTQKVPANEEKEEQPISPNLTPNPEATSPGIIPPFG
jgi:hypothetical protein